MRVPHVSATKEWTRQIAKNPEEGAGDAIYLQTFSLIEKKRLRKLGEHGIGEWGEEHEKRGGWEGVGGTGDDRGEARCNNEERRRGDTGGVMNGQELLPR